MFSLKSSATLRTVLEVLSRILVNIFRPVDVLVLAIKLLINSTLLKITPLQALVT